MPQSEKRSLTAARSKLPLTSRASRVAVAVVLAALLGCMPVALASGQTTHSERSSRAAGTRSRPAASTHAAAVTAKRFGPSGVLMPTKNPPGWREVFSDNFNGDTLNLDHWGAYTGSPGGDPNGVWSPSHVAVQNGELLLRSYEEDGHYVSAGVSSEPGLVQTYGKYLVRYRMGGGIGVSHAVLLWPATGDSGDEIDFSEDNGSIRRRAYTFLHWGIPKTDQTQETIKVNLTHWHTLGVQWTPGKVVYTLDGKPWKTLRSHHVPNIPMVLDLQTQTWCGLNQPPTNTWERCIASTTPPEVDMDVDWVVAYARA